MLAIFPIINDNAVEITEAILNHEAEDPDDTSNEHPAIHFRREAAKNMEKQAQKIKKKKKKHGKNCKSLK